MRVCYFGFYDSEYSRNKILISGLRLNGVEVFECVSKNKGFSKYIDLIRKHKDIKGEYDCMVVGFPGFQAVLLAKFLTDKPVVFDAFVSMYDSVVLDRKQEGRFSVKAFYLWCLDKVTMSISNIVLFDTLAHIDFVCHKFGLDKNKMKRIFVGADTGVFYPREKKLHDGYKVLFYGHYIPLQGVEYIIRAAKLLESHSDIHFELVGNGQEKNKILDLSKSLDIKNINFTENVSLEELSEKINNSDVCLGIFGDTEKASRVIPNKVYESVASGAFVISGDSVAIRELFSGEELKLVSMASPDDIVSAILWARSNVKETSIMAQNAYNKFIRNASIEKLGSDLISVINVAINKNV